MMPNSFSDLINWFEIDIKDPQKMRELFVSCRQLVTILFAVVAAVGLEQLLTTDTTYEYATLLLAYLAILLSWWGYHFGTILGPPETNYLSYLIDCFLLFVYWQLINDRSDFSRFLLWNLAMFSLYWLWEKVRSFKKEREYYDKISILKAVKCNRFFTFLVIIVIFLYKIMENSINGTASIAYTWIFLFLIITIYRRNIHNIYKEKVSPIFSNNPTTSDIERLKHAAKAVSINAHIPHSNFPVGAAIYSDKGNIYVGCNVEYDNYSNTIHAEESAISSMIAAGDKMATHIAVYTKDTHVNFPCGMCRQSLYEIGGSSLCVIAFTDEKSDTKNMGELFPEGFSLNRAS